MSRNWTDFYDRFSYAYYEQLTHYNIDTMNSDYWLENMIEDRMYENENAIRNTVNYMYSLNNWTELN
jgi:hypothetical protein